MNSIKNRLRSSSESAYEYESNFGDDETQYAASSGEDSDYDDGDNDRLSRRASTYSTSEDADAHIARVDEAMDTLNDLHSSPDGKWKKALKHRSGTIVYMTREKSQAGKQKNGKPFLAPVFKGVLDINGFNPSEVFAVVGSRKLWDEWYKEGNLVENLSDSSSLTYMCMQGIAGSSTRDLCLVEKVAGSPTGTISFVSTSVVTPKVPRVSGRVRASIALNGWVLEPIDGGTRLSYYLHVNVRTFVPAFASRRYLARRPTCIASIAAYLEKNGAPAMVDGGSGGGGGGAVAGATPRRRRDSTASKRSSRSTRTTGSNTFAGLPGHVAVDTEAANYGEIQKAIKLVKSIAGSRDFSQAVDEKGTKILMKRDDDGLPTVKGEWNVEGVTTEQVAGTILSEAARREWDVRFSSYTLVTQLNGFDQSELLELHKGVHPIVPTRHYNIIRGVEREDVSGENGDIIVVSRSVKNPVEEVKGPKGSKKSQMDVIGFQLESAGDRGVKITSVVQLDWQDEAAKELTPALRRLLLGEMARLPRAISTFVDDYGYAPYFIRWGEGPAALVADGENGGDLKSGKTTFRVSGDGKGTMKNGQQKCWLQWSDKMYERGLDIKLEPAGAAEIAKVDGIDRTLEFIWSDKVKEGVMISLSRSKKGDGADDVFVGGKRLDATVQMEKGKASKKSAPATAGGKSSGKSSREANDDDEEEEDEKPSRSGNGKTAAAGVGGALAGAGAAVAAAGRKAATPITPASASANNLGPQGGDSSDQACGDTQVKQRGAFPPDAMIILTDDLYFTKSQVMFIGGVGLVAFLWGKFA
ncbi:BQ2448_2927 [Microbotryum intermedium]|uniref:BQ2448_2927 protein n=1 Tax=Microbotryum intermedium TaxID=269621 RepID=A0A238FEV2_9BASI|nr:BQ2448_2927 [Microbotryum intermedium]